MENKGGKGRGVVEWNQKTAKSGKGGRKSGVEGSGFKKRHFVDINTVIVRS